jgi:beta-lactamase regulating signal transducer with metallopeptidase domain
VDAVLNWVLQGAIVALAATVFMKAVPALGAGARYGLWWLALGAVLVLPAASQWRDGSSPVWPSSSSLEGAGTRPDSARRTSLESAGDGLVDTRDNADALIAMPLAIKAAEPTLLVLWAIWAGLSTIRVGYALGRLRSSRRRCLSFPKDREMRLLHWSAIRGRGQSALLGAGHVARLAVSDEVRAAAVLGFGPPIIAVSPVLLRGLSDAELDHVILHEWAHVQRRDEIAKVMQQVICAIVGWHPGVWWIAHRLDLEREVACDERAVAVIGSAKGYARCLTKLVEVVGNRRGLSLVPSALEPAQLSTRVGRLCIRRRASVCAAAGLATLGSVVVLTTGALVAAVECVAFEMPTLPAPSAAVAHVFETSREVRVPPPTSDPGAASPAVSTRDRRPRKSVTTVNSNAAPASTPAIDEHAAPAARAPEPARLGALEAIELPDRHEQTVSLAGTLPVVPVVPPSALSGTAATPQPVTPSSVTPWGAMADAGVSMGRGSQKAAVATGGFFKRIGKSIGGSF